MRGFYLVGRDVFLKCIVVTVVYFILNHNGNSVDSRDDWNYIKSLNDFLRLKILILNDTVPSTKPTYKS